MQQAVLKARALYVDMVGELEAALERTGRDALIEHVPLRLAALDARLFRAADEHAVLAALDRKLIFGEASDGDGNAIGILPVRSIL